MPFQALALDNHDRREGEMPGADPKPPEGDSEALSQQDAADSGLHDMTAEALESVKPVDGGIATEGSKGHVISEDAAKPVALAK